MSLSLDQIPGYSEAILTASVEQLQTQEDDWLNAPAFIGGIQVRRATLRDYVLVMRFIPAVLCRQKPSPEEMMLFLWLLSPERAQWDCEPSGWRKAFPALRRLARQNHHRKVKRTLKIRELQKAMLQAELQGEIYQLPENHPFSKSIADLFKYIDSLFEMKPAGVKSGGAGVMYFLTSWFNIVQRNFHLPSEEVWNMPLPVLFARLREQQSFQMRGLLPDFNRKRDAINQRIMDALRSGKTTESDLLAGKFNFYN